MKKIFLIIAIVCCSIKSFCQSYPTAVTDTSGYLRYIVANKQQFIGQPFSTLYNFLQISPKMFTPRAGIHHNSYAETSITLSFKFVATAEELSTTYPHLKIAWQPPYLNREEGLDMKFLYQRQGVGWNNVIYNRYQNIIIKDIYIIR